MSLGLFLSTTINRVDKKGRVSVPAGFRAAVADTEDQGFQGVILFPSHNYPCLEGVGIGMIEDLARRLDTLDFLSSAQDDLATVLFASSTQLPFDNEGRIILTDALRAHAGLKTEALFAGMGRKFQVWDPGTYDERQRAALESVRRDGLTLPSLSGTDKGGQS